MDTFANRLTTLLSQTLGTPREAARQVMALPIGLPERWQVLALVVILSVILTQATVMLAPAEEAAMMRSMLGSPLQSGLVQAAVLVAMVFAVHFVGRAMGGAGAFADALLLIAWLEWVMVCLQVVQLVASVVLPLLASAIGVMGVALFFWLLTQFVLELHGFRSPVRVFGMIVIVLVALAFGVALVFGLIGVSLPGA